MIRYLFIALEISLVVARQPLASNTQVSEAEARAAVRAHPKSSSRHVTLGNSLYLINRPEEAEWCYERALQLEPSLGHVHLMLGLSRVEHGRVAKAEQSFRSAIQRLPKDSRAGTAHSNLASLLFERGDWRGAESSYRQALQLNPHGSYGNEAPWWLGVLLARRGATAEAKPHLRKAVDLKREEGKPPVSLIMSLVEGPDWYLENSRTEKRAFGDACADGEARGGLARDVSMQLRKTLKALRTQENKKSWIVEWLLESELAFKGQAGAAYGTVGFAAWSRAASSTIFHDTLRSFGNLHAQLPDQRPIVLVAGSALGEHCLFAVALGARCIGYDLLCESMTSHAQRLVRQHGLAHLITYHCGDAADAPGLESVAAVWLNDRDFPEATHGNLRKRCETKLSSGALVLSFKPASWKSCPQLPEAERIRISVSWAKDQLVTLRQKVAEQEQEL